MKRQRLAKIFFYCALSMAVSSIPLVGQEQPNPQQPAPGPRGQNPPPQPEPQSDSPTAQAPTSDFLNTAIEINEAEVQLGQLATTKAQTDSVRMYAQMLVRDHSMALQKLQKLGFDTNRSTPTLSANHQDLKTRLSRMIGSQFDRAYIEAMVTGHRDAVKLFEEEIAAGPSRPQQASKPTDAEATSVARELLPTIKHHLDEGEKIQKTLK